MDRMFMNKEGQQILNDIIKPEKVVFMHISPERLDYFQSLVKDIPSMIIFSEEMQMLTL